MQNETVTVIADKLEVESNNVYITQIMHHS